MGYIFSSVAIESLFLAGYITVGPCEVRQPARANESGAIGLS